MKLHSFSLRTAVLVAALLLIPGFAFAQYPFEGIYLGSYDGASDDGEFGLVVDSSGRATLAAYDAVDDIGYLEENIVLDPDGSFAFVTRRGAHIEGQLGPDGVTGSWYAPGTEGGFAGQRMPAEGFLANATGFYSGQIMVRRRGSALTDYGRMTAIVAADGSAFFLIDQAISGAPGFTPGDFGFGSGFGFGSDLSWDFDIDLGLGLGLGMDMDMSMGRDRTTGSSSGGCPFFFYGSSYSFNVSVGFLDFSWDFSRHTCYAFWGLRHFADIWNDHLDAFQYSGGIVQIDSGGIIEGELLDGLTLEGLLDTQGPEAEGLVLESAGVDPWTGYWKIERRYDSDHIVAAKRFAQTPDVDGNGAADVLWSYTTAGDDSAHFVATEKTVTELAESLPRKIRDNPLWSLVAVGQVYADPAADYLWRNTLTGEVFIASGNGAGPASVELGSDYRIVGGSDFNADGLLDILVWNDHSGASLLMSDPTGGPDLTLLPVSDDPDWVSTAVADFDGDNFPDILSLNHRTQELRVQLMQGLSLVHQIELPAADLPAEWHTVLIGDFDGDGGSDLLLRNDNTGDGSVWRMRDAGVTPLK